MGKYLKMSNWFPGMTESQITYYVYDGGIGYGESEAAAHAINSHDELVAEVERLSLENDSLMKCRMAAREFFNCTVASGGLVKISSSNKDATDEVDKASDWLETELNATSNLVNK